MAKAEIPQRSLPPANLVKGAERMCPAVLGWLNDEFLRGGRKLIGMEIPIGGVLITSGIIFMMGCTWSMIQEMATKYGRHSSKKKRLSGRKGLLSLPSHHLNPQRVLLTRVNSIYPKKLRLQL